MSDIAAICAAKTAGYAIAIEILFFVHYYYFKLIVIYLLQSGNSWFLMHQPEVPEELRQK